MAIGTTLTVPFSLGNPITGGDNNTILFIDGAGNLADNTDLVWNDGLGFFGIDVSLPTLVGTVFEVSGISNIHVTSGVVTANQIVGNVGIISTDIFGSYNYISNSVTGNIGFNGCGDLTPFGFSAEGVVMGHRNGSTTDTTIALIDEIGGTPTFVVQSTFFTSLGAGALFTINPNQFSVTNNSANNFLNIDLTTGASQFNDLTGSGGTVSVGKLIMNDDGAGDITVTSGTTGATLGFNSSGTVQIIDTSGSGISLDGSGNVQIKKKVIYYSSAPVTAGGVSAIRYYSKLAGVSVIPITSIFKNVGMFRLSVYLTVTGAASPGTLVSVKLHFTDDSGAKSANVLGSVLVDSLSNFYSGTYTFQQFTAGIISYEMVSTSGTGKMSVYFCLEQLE